MAKKWCETPAFKIAVTVALISGAFGFIYVVLPLLFQRPSESQSPIVIRGGEGGKAIGAGGGAGVAIGTAGTLDMRGGEGGRVVVLNGTDGQAPGAGGGGPSVIVNDTNPMPITGKGEDGGNSEFAGIRASGGKGGEGLGGGSGGEMIYGCMHLTAGVYKVTVGQGGTSTTHELTNNSFLGNGGDGAPGIVIIRYRTDGSTDQVDEATGLNEMIKEANKAFQPTK